MASGGRAEAVFPLTKTQPNAVFSFGRFQPPTVGHALLIDQVIDTAKKNSADAIVFVSSTENKPSYVKSKKSVEMMESGAFTSGKDNENPLPVAIKVDVLQKQHSGKPVQFVNTTLCNCKSIMQIIPVLKENGYEQITMMVGSDRVEGFQEMFSKYFPDVKVAGIERVEAVANARSMSGTKLRIAAVKEDFPTFRDNVVMGDFNEGGAKELMNMVRIGLGYPPVAGGRRKTIKRRKVIRRKSRARRR